MRKFIGIIGLLASVCLISAYVTGLRAETSYSQKLQFATSLEEAMGHLWAVNKDLDENDPVRALYHASHPILELYERLEPMLVQEDPELDAEFRASFSALIERTGPEMTPQEASRALDEARSLITRARTLVVGSRLSNDPAFKSQIIRNLLEISLTEYQRAVVGEEVRTVTDFQDATAFFVRSQEIFKTIESKFDNKEREVLKLFYTDLANAYGRAANPVQVASLTKGVMERFAKKFPPDPAFDAPAVAAEMPAETHDAEMGDADMSEAGMGEAESGDGTVEAGMPAAGTMDPEDSMPNSRAAAMTEATPTPPPRPSRNKLICREGFVKIVTVGNDRESCVAPETAEGLFARGRARRL